LNKGDGNIWRSYSNASTDYPEGLGAFAVGDFNEDGKLNLVVDAMAGSDGDVLLGNAMERSASCPYTQFIRFLRSIAVDLNGDGPGSRKRLQWNIDVFRQRAMGRSNPHVPALRACLSGCVYWNHDGRLQW